jgi:hypothetical protein
LGSDTDLVFQADMPITFVTPNGTKIGMTSTNMMGAYEYKLMTKDIPEGTSEIKVMFKEKLIRTVSVSGGDGSSAPRGRAVAMSVAALIFGVVAALF